MGRDRSRSRSRDRERRSPARRRARSRSRERRKRSRSRSPEWRRDGERPRSRSPDRTRGDGGDDGKKAARLAKLQAWKSQQQQQQQIGAQPDAPAAAPDGHLQDAVRRAQEAAAAAAARAAAPPPQLPPQQQQVEGVDVEAAAAEEEDPLDAFMAAEVLPEVQAREVEERAAAAEERRKLSALLAAGKLPKALAELIADEEEEAPDMLIQLPANKVKLVIGAGGEKVKLIQRKTKCRIQHAKGDDELVMGWGGGPAAAAAAASAAPGEPRLVTLQLFGNAEACEAARAMIMEAVENREQKAKQRAKEYEKKRDAKRGERQIYHMRHARDYEALGLPLGASKAEAKAAFRKLALRWHPDKNPGNREEAEAKFQEISRAYESLMTTDEDTRVEQLGS